MFTRKHMVQICRARSSATSSGGLCSVAMCETLYAEVDLTDAVMDMVKQGRYSVSFGRDFRADASQRSKTRPALSFEPA